MSVLVAANRIPAVEVLQADRLATLKASMLWFFGSCPRVQVGPFGNIHAKTERSSCGLEDLDRIASFGIRKSLAVG
jgi:hypothetical protein